MGVANADPVNVKDKVVIGKTFERIGAGLIDLDISVKKDCKVVRIIYGIFPMITAIVTLKGHTRITDHILAVTVQFRKSG